MAEAARAYRYNARTAAPEPRRESRPDVRVLPGKGRTDERLAPISAFSARAFKVSIAAIVIMAVFACLCVSLIAANVGTLTNIQSLESSIDNAVSTGNELEVQHSILSDSSRIQKQAKSLGMSAPKTTTYLTIATTPHVVHTVDGNVSIANTLATCTQAAAASK